MKKKNIATVMASTMAMASVMPVFAAEENVTTVKVNVRTANGEQLTVNRETTVDGETVYSVVKEKLDDTSAAVSTAKKAMDEVIANLEKMSKETIKVMENGNVVVKNKYDINIDKEKSIYKYSVNQNDGTVTDNKIVVVVKNNETEEVTNYEFEGINKYDLDNNFGQGESEFEGDTIDLADKTQYETMVALQYQLEKNADKIIVTKERFTDSDQINGEYNIRLTIALKNGTEVAQVILKNVNSLDKDTYVALPANGDLKGHWAENLVLTAMFNNWVDNSTKFRPEDSITRAEFVKIVNRAFNIEVNDKETKELLFTDLDANMWYNKEVAAAVKAGYINGYEDGTFKPNQPITRQEASKIIAMFASNKTVVEENDIHTDFNDDAQIGIWADDSVEFLNKMGVITGYEDNTFKPQGNIKRAEAAVMIVRTVQAMQAITPPAIAE